MLMWFSGTYIILSVKLDALRVGLFKNEAQKTTLSRSVGEQCSNGSQSTVLKNESVCLQSLKKAKTTYESILLTSTVCSAKAQFNLSLYAAELHCCLKAHHIAVPRYQTTGDLRLLIIWGSQNAFT